MKNSQNINDEQALILDYLYGALSLDEKKAFQQRLKTDADFKALYNTQMELDEMINHGTKPVIDNKRVQGVRWSLQKRLHKKNNKQSSIFSDLWSRQVSFKTQLAGMALMFILGVFFAQNQTSNRLFDLNNDLNLTAVLNANSPLSLIKNDDFEIVDLSLDQINADNGDVKVNFSLASKTEVNTNLNNPEFQNLLVHTMSDNVSDSLRLDLIELLKDQVDSKQVRKALIDRLLNDPNPGVRIIAAETLAKLSHEKSVRMVLRQALKKDINSGVRVEVFQALAKHLDDQNTLDLFKKYGSKDGNQFIREQSKNLLKQQDKTQRI